MHRALEPSVPWGVEYVSIEEALERLRGTVSIKPTVERVMLWDAYKRVLAQDVVSQVDVPAYDTSHMDGYAVRSSDISSARPEEPVSLRLVGSAPPRESSSMVLGRGEACRVLTGAPMPRGADTVVPVESAEASGGMVIIRTPLPAGSNVYPRGRDVRRGELVLERGRRVKAADVVLLGKLGVMEVDVYRAPRVAIVPTGSELTEDPRTVSEGMVLETHGWLAAKLVEEAGGIPVKTPPVPDDPEAVKSRLAPLLDAVDMVLTIGGTSAGETDVVKQAIDSLPGGRVLCRGVKMDRGRVAGVAAAKGRPIIMLPGPVQGMVNAFICLAHPLLLELMGHPKPPPVVKATLSRPWQARKMFSSFKKIVHVELFWEGDVLKARPLVGETESTKVISSADGFIMVPEDVESLFEGQIVDVQLVPGLWRLPSRSKGAG